MKLFDKIIFTLTLLAITTIYLLCMSPYVGAGDSGELIVTAAKLAAPHPPGYPLYTFFAHLFSLLPISSVAWRIGLFSVVCQVAAAAVLFKFLLEWLGRTWIACAITLLYSLSPLIWRYAIEAEVFALNNLFAVILIYLLWRSLPSSPLMRTVPSQGTLRMSTWFTTPQSAMPLFGFVLGLAATNHLTILMFAFPFMLYFLWIHRAQTTAKSLALTIATFALGLTPYLYMFYLGQNRALYAWGDFSTWNGFFTHVLRSEYGSFQLATGDKEDSHFWSKLYYFGQEMVRNIYWPGVAALAYAVYHIGKRKAGAAFPRLLLAAFIFFTILFQSLSNLDLSIPLYYHTQARMWMLPLLLLTLIIGWAMSIQKYLGAIVVPTIIGMAAWNWKIQDKSHDVFFRDVGRTMLNSVAPNAVVLMREDTYVNALRYLQEIDGIRTDVKVIPLDALWWPWCKELVEKNVPGFTIPGEVIRKESLAPGQFTLAQLIEANIDKFPIYISKIFTEEEITLREKFWGFPYGFHSRIKRRSQDFTIDELKLETGPFLALQLPDSSTHRVESWETFIKLNYSMVKQPMADLLAARANGRPDWLAYSEVIKKGLNK